MKIDILTLFPEMFAPLKTSVLEKAQQNNIFELNIVNIRDFSTDKNKRCDDYPFGGGAGMLMTPQPLYDAITSVKQDNSYIIYMSPKGTTLKQSLVENYSKKENIIIICGHYEGIDQRIIDMFVDEEVSIGDYVLTGGEIPAMVFCDTILRYVPNVIKTDSLSEESFSNDNLEYPQYTRPQNFKDIEVPEILLSGNHQKIAEWRKQESIKLTKSRRPDIIRGDK